MNRFFILTLWGALLFGALPAFAADRVNVFACEPEWAALADAIGGDAVESYAATHANQDPHHIRARPSLIARMRRSDIVLCSGAQLETGWLPILLQKAGRPDVQPGGDNFLMAATMVPILEKPHTIDRSLGDLHPAGNPHVHLNPYHILTVADVLYQRMTALLPSRAADIQRTYEGFVARWRHAIANWEAKAASLKGKRVITHHRSFSYLLDWLDIDLVNTLEEKPGIAPGAGHLNSLLKTSVGVSAILQTPYDPSNAGEWLSEKTGIPRIVLPYTVGGDTESVDLFTLYDRMIAQLLGTIR